MTTGQFATLGCKILSATRAFAGALVLAATGTLLAATPARAAVDLQFKNFTDTPDPVPGGGLFSYTLEIENSGSDPSPTSTLTLQLDTALVTFVATGTDGRCSYAAGTGIVTCNLGNLAGTLVGGAGTSVVIKARATPGATALPAAANVTATLVSSDLTENTGNNVQTQNTTIVNGANLTITSFSSSASTVVAGATVTYSTVVQNLGPSPAADARLTFVLAAGLEFQTGTVSGSSWSCAATGAVLTGQTLICNYASSIDFTGSAGTDSAATLSWKVRVAGQQTGTLTTSADVTSSTADGDGNNNHADAAITVTAGTDLAMAKSVNADPVVGDLPMFFTLQVTNRGPYAADTIVVKDTIPLGFTDINTTGTNPSWTCSVAGRDVTCTTPTMAVGNAPPITVNATAPPSASIDPIAANNSNSSNSATVTSGTQEADPSNNTSTVTYTLKKNGVDLLPVNLTRGPSPVAVGSNVTTAFAVKNNGPRIAMGAVGNPIVATFQLPVGESYLSAVGTGWTCGASSATATVGSLVTCSIAGPLGVNATTSTISIVSKAVTPDTTLNGVACVGTGAGAPPNEVELDPSNDCSAPYGIRSTGAKADLMLAKAVASPTLAANSADVITYTLTVTNNGPDEALAVNLTDTIPMWQAGGTTAGQTLAPTSITAVASGGGVCPATTSATVSCDWASIPATVGSNTRTVTITVGRPVREGNWTNSAYVFANGTGDPALGNNGASDTGVTVAAVVDLFVAQKSASPAPVKAGVDVTYTIQIRNLGPSTADAVTLKDVFTDAPGGFKFISASNEAGACAYDNPTMTATCGWTSIEPNGVRTAQVKVRPLHVAGSAPRAFKNTATVSLTPGVSAAVELRTTNNTFDYVLDILPSDIDLKIEETDLRDPVGFDPSAAALANPDKNLIVYQVTVTNNGPSFATSVNFDDTWAPPSATVGRALTYMCDLDTATKDSICGGAPRKQCSVSGATINCPMGDMAANTTKSLYLIYRITGEPVPTGETYKKTAVVRATETETLLGNNIIVENTTVRLLADLEAVSKSASLPLADVDQAFDWTITVRNNGPSTGKNVVVTDTLPASMVLAGVPTASSGSCSVAGSKITCALGDVNYDTVTPANSVRTVTIPVRVTALPPYNAGAAANTIDNAATVSTDSVDVVAANDKITGTAKIQGASIAGVVFVDTKDTGTKLASDPGIRNVNIKLTGIDKYTGATITRTATTANDGSYSFTGLPPSDGAGYTLMETQPAGYFDGKDEKAGAVIAGSKGTATTTGVDAPATDTIAGIVLNGGQNLTGYNFGELAPASIAGRVWHDKSNDGLINSGESTFLSGISVTLSGTDDLGNIISAAKPTDGSGAYKFSDLRPGTYTVTETPPAPALGYLPGLSAVGTVTNVSSTAAAVPGSGTAFNTIASPDYGNKIETIAIKNGDAAVEYNFGELRPGSIAGSVFYDSANAGTQGPLDPGLDQVTLTLTGKDYLGVMITPVVVATDPAGKYIFPTVPPGTYSVTVTQPTGYTPGAVKVGSLSGVAGPTVVTGIVLKSGDTGTAYNFPELSGAISGYVYDDVGGLNIRGGQPGIAGVKLTLTGCALTAARTATTDSSGYYLFSGIDACAAGYTVTETQPTGYTEATTTAGSTGGVVTLNTISSLPVTGTLQSINNNFGEHNTGNTNLTCTTATPGTKNVREPFNWIFTVKNTTTVGAPNSKFASTLPVGLELFGVTPTATQGTCTGTAGGNAVNCDLGFVNGLPSVTATITVTVPVRLTSYPAGPTGPAGAASAAIGKLTASGSVSTAGTDTTGTDNSCSIDVTGRQSTLAGTVFEDPDNNGLKATTEVGISTVTLTLTGKDIYNNPVSATTMTLADGTYKFAGLAPADPAGYIVTETQPLLYADGKHVAGSLGGDASVANVTSGIVLPQGTDATGYDFAEISQGLAGSVYIDSNDNGIREGTEKGIPNVTIRVTGLSSTGAPVDITTQTDADGNYLFGAIPPSSAAGYTVTETQPTQFANGKVTAGTLGGTAGTNDTITKVVLPAGRLATVYNFGEKGAKVCGYVYNDLNNNGIKNANEIGIPNVTLTLTGTDATAKPLTQVVQTQGLSTAATDVGRYCFVDLPLPGPGGYTITETPPADTTPGKITPGTLGGSAGTFLISSIPIPAAGGTGDAYNFGHKSTAAAALSGFVWLDSNHDRARNEITNGRGGWKVELVRGDLAGAYAVEATTTTNPDGSYRFEGLPPGSGYSVLFRNPVGNYVFGYLTNLTLTALTELSEQNQPIDPSGVVYDVLTRKPVPGATVRLNGPAGFDPNLHLIGGAGNVSQVTGTTGEYRYLLLPGAPLGTYSLGVTVPSGYVQRVSTALPPCTAILSVTAAALPSLVQNNDLAPVLGQPIANPATCPTTTGGLPAGANTTQYYLTFSFNAGAAGFINNHIPIEATPTTNALIVAKTTPKMDVMRGELVPYTITVRNGDDVRHTDIALVDMIPPGFKYRAGSGSINGVIREPVINGRQLTWSALTIERGQTITAKLMLIVGTGVGEGEYINQAWANNAFVNQVVSNVATAAVRIVPDPNFDCSDIIGKVFDDKNRDGLANDGEPGLANVRLATVNGQLITTDSQGRFHITCADVPNAQRGSNFVLKIDERTLPTGYRLTTPNPGVVVLTRGKMAKLNFGASVHRVVRVDVMNEAFDPGTTTLRAQWAGTFDQVFPAIQTEQSVLRIGYGRTGAEDKALAAERLRVLVQSVNDVWRRKYGTYHLVIETEVYPAGAGK